MSLGAPLTKYSLQFEGALTDAHLEGPLRRLSLGPLCLLLGGPSRRGIEGPWADVLLIVSIPGAAAAAVAAAAVAAAVVVVVAAAAAEPRPGETKGLSESLPEGPPCHSDLLLLLGLPQKGEGVMYEDLPRPQGGPR